MRRILKMSGFIIVPGFIFSFVFFCSKNEQESSLKDIRLLDFQPKPMLVVKETKVEKAKFPVIDAHNHLRRVINAGADIEEQIKTDYIRETATDRAKDSMIDEARREILGDTPLEKASMEKRKEYMTALERIEKYLEDRKQREELELS